MARDVIHRESTSGQQGLKLRGGGETQLLQVSVQHSGYDYGCRLLSTGPGVRKKSKSARAAELKKKGKGKKMVPLKIKLGGFSGKRKKESSVRLDCSVLNCDVPDGGTSFPILMESYGNRPCSPTIHADQDVPSKLVPFACPMFLQTFPILVSVQVTFKYCYYTF